MCRCMCVINFWGRVHLALPSVTIEAHLLTAGPSASDRLASRMEEGGATVQSLMAGAFARLSTGVQGVGQTVGAGVQTWVSWPS